jgi:hypothetical protein
MWSLVYSGCFAISSVGLSGDLALFSLSYVVHITPATGSVWRAILWRTPPGIKSWILGFPLFYASTMEWVLLCCGNFTIILARWTCGSSRSNSVAYQCVLGLQDCELMDLDMRVQNHVVQSSRCGQSWRFGWIGLLQMLTSLIVLKIVWWRTSLPLMNRCACGCEARHQPSTRKKYSHMINV